MHFCQTYGIYHKKDENVELLTYVDHVDVNGPAFKGEPNLFLNLILSISDHFTAGLREGDVILSINGQSMEKADHRSLVDYIQSCEKSMRMVVLFENCVLKVELHKRFIKLRVSIRESTTGFDSVLIPVAIACTQTEGAESTEA